MSVSKLVNPKALFFDMDNTIINTRDGDAKTLVKLNCFLNERYNMDYETAENITSLFLETYRELRPVPDDGFDEWRLSLWKKILGPSFAHLSDEVYKEWLLLRYRYVRASPDVKSFLKELRSLYRLALITNGSSVAQWEKIDICGLKPYFDSIIVSGDTPWKKPAVEIFHKACDELNMKPEQCMMIGDRIETDIAGGKAAKLGATVWINFDSSYQRPPSEDDCPDFIISDILELKQILAQLNVDNLSNIS